MNYYPKYPGDYLRDTGDLSLAEHGAYNLLLDYYYSTGSKLPRERRRIYRLLRADGPEDHAAVDVVLQKFWIETADGWENRKANEVIAKVKTVAEKRRQAALKRWSKARKEEQKGDTQPMQVHMQMHSGSTCTQNQNQISKERVYAREAPLPSDQPDSAFIDMKPFQAAYPKRAGSQPWREAAAAAAARIREGHDLEVMIEGARRYRIYCEAAGEVGTKYVMHAATFLGPELHYLEPWEVPAQPTTPKQKRQKQSDDLVRSRLKNTAEETGYGDAGTGAGGVRGHHHGGDAVREGLARRAQ